MKEHGKEKSKLDDLGPPVRDRSAGMIEGTRMGGSTFGIVTLVAFFLLFLAVVGALVFLLYWFAWPHM